MLAAAACGEDGDVINDPEDVDCAKIKDDCEGKLAVQAIAATQTASTRVQEIGADLATSCQAISVALGGPGDEVAASGDAIADAQGWCNVASGRLAAAELSVTASSTVCVYPLAALAACEAACAGVDACDAKPDSRCARGASGGSCSGDCSGSCFGTEPPVDCSGTCTGACTGTCGGAPVDGATCSAPCYGECSGSCATAAGAQVACSGICIGACSVELQEVGCTSRVTSAPPAPCTECSACSLACSWQSNLTARCEPVPVVVELTGADPATEAALRSAIGGVFASLEELEVISDELPSMFTLGDYAFVDNTAEVCVVNALADMSETVAPLEALLSAGLSLTSMLDG